ncbi:caspase family protein [Amycolatopsis rifamycinica]|uniref:caspase family protein n=1 Tax=Amycolatopsis rifamycinica TaxID=287986 RepID=UPI0009FFEF05|nr:caspase family protein [Amycolatopsis rifamycinica]
MRYLIAAGTRLYQHYAELPAVHTDVERIVTLFASMGYERILESVSLDPIAAEFEDALSAWCSTAELAADDVVVIYYAGHGDRPLGGRYRLACVDSEHHRPRSWLSLQNLAEVFGSSPLRNVLFLIDACHAAAGAAEISTVTDAIVATRTRGDNLGSGTWILGSARHRDLADDGAFALAVSRAAEAGDGPSQQFISPAEIVNRVNRIFAKDGLRQRAAASSADQTKQPPFFINPAFDPYAQIDVDGQDAERELDISSHFGPRGRGVEHVHDPGMYFTGRSHALTVIRAHLNGSGGHNVLVVTADPGSGKSAVLGQLVMEKCSDISINARHQTLDSLVSRLAASSDIKATTLEGLLSILANRKKPLRVIVDSLDEAGPVGDKVEARRISWDLIRPLGAVPCVRLVVGSRRELLSHIGDRQPVVDLDDIRYSADTSTKRYVEQILMDVGSPYHLQPATAADIAHEVAQRAGLCFLVARMTASALLRDDAIDTSVPGWAERLPSDVGAAFDAYLQRVPRERHSSTMTLLTTLAFGEGNGLPRRIWVRVASRVGGVPLTETHIDTLVDEDSSYLTSVEVDGVKYFRLYHQELSDYLKNHALKHRDLVDIQESFVDELLHLASNCDWKRVHPYIISHLATHAAAANSISDLVADPAFVLAANPVGLLRAVRHSSCDPTLAMIIERCADILEDASSKNLDRAAQLAFVAETYGATLFARRAEGISTSLERVRAEPRKVTPHRIVGQHTERTYSNRSAHWAWMIEDVEIPGSGRIILANPPETAHVHVWSLNDVSQSTLLIHSAPVTGLSVIPGTDNRPLAVTLDQAGELRIWDLVDQVIVRRLPRAGYHEILDIGTSSSGAPLIVCKNPRRVAVIDLNALATVYETDVTTPSDVPFWSPGATACLVRTGDNRTALLLCDGQKSEVSIHLLEAYSSPRIVLVIGSIENPVLMDRFIYPEAGTIAAIYEPSKRICLLDVDSGEISASPFNGFEWKPEGGFVEGDEGEPLFFGRQMVGLLAGSLAAGLITKNVEGSSQTFIPFVSDKRIFAVTVPDDHTAIAVVDCVSGNYVGEPLRGHESSVCAVHLIRFPESGSISILAVGNDGTARLWPWRSPVMVQDVEQNLNNNDQMSHPFEAEVVLDWRANPKMILFGPPGIRRVDVRILDELDGKNGQPFSEHVMSVSHLREHDCSEDADGTIQILSWEYSHHTTSKTDPDIAYGQPVGTYYWNRIPVDGHPYGLKLDWLHGGRGRISACLIPSNSAHPNARVVAFDALRGQVQLMESPSDAGKMVQVPWNIDSARDLVRSTAFTSLEGDAVLMVIVRKATGYEETVTGRRSPDNTRVADSAASHVESELPSLCYLWDVTKRQAARDTPLVLLAGIEIIAPEHGKNGTRYVAMRSRGGSTIVLDLATDQRHVVQAAQQSADRYDKATFTGRHCIRWANLRDSTSVLLSINPSGSDDLLEDEFVQSVPVTVWRSDAPDHTYRLPVCASHILWTGSAPNGEALVAVSDTKEITLCHLASNEKVWATSLPALVVSFTAVNCGETFNFAVGTQQGVILLRPRITGAWRRRLGLS